MNYLAPIRLALVPFYAGLSRSAHLAGDPERRLLVGHPGGVHAGAIGVEIRGGWHSRRRPWCPLTPLLWPLVWNDFRELQLALPFVLWAVAGSARPARSRLAAVGRLWMLACRQEFAVMVATFAFLPPREPEDLTHDPELAAGVVLRSAWPGCSSASSAT